MQQTLRIIDANFNRAREALRVIEEYARFVLNDASIAKQCKVLRHDLGNAICGVQLRAEGLGAEAVIAARDTTGDVGTAISLDSEQKREDARHVALASAKRLSEALRVIEEYSKTIDATVARRVERIRYEGYELERRVSLIIRAREKLSQMRLYVLLTESLCKRDWFETARVVLENGADCVQLREKNLADVELLPRAKRLANLCRDLGKTLIINDRADIAAAAGAHGVHLGQDDVDVRSARSILPGEAIVGVSTHTVEQIERAIRDSPDYIAVGPMFSSETKPQEHIAGAATLAAARTRTALPLVAIGGLTEERAAGIVEKVDCCICLCSSIISQADPGAATRSLRARIDASWQTRQTG